MAEIDGIEYDQAECDRFIRQAAGIADVIGKIRAEEGDAYADRYLNRLFDVIRRQAGAPG